MSSARDIKQGRSLRTHAFKNMRRLKRTWMTKRKSRGPETYRYGRHIYPTKVEWSWLHTWHFGRLESLSVQCGNPIWINGLTRNPNIRGKHTQKKNTINLYKSLKVFVSFVKTYYMYILPWASHRAGSVWRCGGRPALGLLESSQPAPPKVLRAPSFLNSRKDLGPGQASVGRVPAGTPLR